MWRAAIGLCVREKGNRTGCGEQTVAHTLAGVIREGGLNADRSDVETQVLELLDFDIGRYFVQLNREKGAFHLGGQDALDAAVHTFIAQDAQLVARLINREKIRQPLDVVPMSVGQQQGQGDRLLVELLDQQI